MLSGLTAYMALASLKGRVNIGLQYESLSR